MSWVFGTQIVVDACLLHVFKLLKSKVLGRQDFFKGDGYWHLFSSIAGTFSSIAGTSNTSVNLGISSKQGSWTASYVDHSEHFKCPSWCCKPASLQLLLTLSAPEPSVLGRHCRCGLTIVLNEFSDSFDCKR